MKVKSVVIKAYNAHGDVEAVTRVEGVGGVYDLHYISRDGMVCANARINGTREGVSIPMDRVISVHTIL